MPGMVELRIEKFLEDLKNLRRNPIVPDLYHFGYCPKCDDITRIEFVIDHDPWAQNPPIFTICKKCGFCSTKEIKSVEIPPKFWKKCERMRSRTNQIRVHKEEMRRFLELLDEERQRRNLEYEKALRRLAKYVGKKKAA